MYDLPEVLQRDFKLLKVGENGFHNRPILVAPATLVEAKCKVLLHSGKTNGIDLIALGDIDLGRTRVKCQVDATTKGAPGDVARMGEDFLAMSVPEKDTVRVGYIVLRRVSLVAWNQGVVSLVINFIVSGVQVEWMRSVDVTVGYGVRISEILIW